MVSHLDSTYRVISERALTQGTNSVFPNDVLPLPNNRCLIAGKVGATASSYQDQAFVSCVSDTGVVWYKEYGNPTLRDAGGFVFKGTTDTTFWFVYTAAIRADSVGAGSEEPIIRMKAVLLSSSGVELQTKALNKNWTYTYNYVGKQLADGSVVFGYLVSDRDVGYYGLIQKFSPSMQLVWESRIPLPYVATDIGRYPYASPLSIYPTDDGGFICAGGYTCNTCPYSVWLGKMDSLGCFDAGCSMVGTASLDPANGEARLRVFPNPAQDYLTIATENIKGNAYLYNGLGQVVKAFSINSFSNTPIAVYDMPNGIYFFSVTGANGQQYGQQRVVVQHE